MYDISKVIDPGWPRDVTMAVQIMDVASQHLCKNAEVRKWQVSKRCRTQISLNMTLEIRSQVNVQLFIVSLESFREDVKLFKG